MPEFSVNRRGLMAAAAAAPVIAAAAPAIAQPPPGRDPSGGAPTADQQRRMKWWHDAKFGMFIHFGLYAARGRHEWDMEDEAVLGRLDQHTQIGIGPFDVPPGQLLDDIGSPDRLMQRLGNRPRGVTVQNVDFDTHGDAGFVAGR